MSESITREPRSAAVTGGATRIDARDSVDVMAVHGSLIGGRR